MELHGSGSGGIWLNRDPIRRRDFLATVASGAGALLLAGCTDGRRVAATRSRADLGESGPDRIGIQLYTVRSLMADDPAATLDALAAVGYHEVEFARYFGHAPAVVRGWLDGAGLAAPAAHVGMEGLVGDGLASSLEAATVLGHRWLVLPWIPAPQRTEDGYRAVADALNRAGAAAQEAQVRVAFHNHDFEFEPLAGAEGPTGYDLLLERLDPSLVDMEIDLHWSTVGGADFNRLVADHPGRFALCHLKDVDPQGGMADVGAGTIDWPAVFALSEKAGFRHFFVEHDNPADPMASARASYHYLSPDTP